MLNIFKDNSRHRHDKSYCCKQILFKQINPGKERILSTHSLYFVKSAYVPRVSGIAKPFNGFGSVLSLIKAGHHIEQCGAHAPLLDI